MRTRSSQNILCWICDYSLILLGFIAVIAVALLRWFNADAYISPLPFPPMAETPTPPLSMVSTVAPFPGVMESPSVSFLTPPEIALTATPTFLISEKSEFVFVFIPVVWSGGVDEFRRYAHQQVDYYIRASNMDKYFQIRVEILDTGLTGVALSDDDLVNKIVSFGLDHIPGDRYIGVTDGDISMDGSSDVSGWTYGSDALGLVAESSGLEIVVHELGHTFGLCDEYNYSYWLGQNEEFLGGCPNPYPLDCSQEVSSDIVCLGNPAPSGANSLMGPSGLPGSYEFNHECYQHLQRFFEMYSRE